VTPHGGDRSRRRVVRSFLPVLVLATAVGASACATTRVPPADGAAPGAVARACLDALVAGDCAATRDLLAGGVDPANSDLYGVGHVDAYCGLVGPAGSLSDLTYGVTFALRDVPRTSGWQDGDTNAFIRLVREPEGPWRVAGVGSGR
jgi:hypothetical protein